MTESTEKANVFVQLKEATLQIREGFKTITEIAPDIALYNTLVESQNNPFLRGIMNTPENIDLNDQEIQFAVYIKELYEKGQFEIVKSLMEGTLENVLKEYQSSPPSTANSESYTNANTTSETSNSNGISMKNDNTNYNHNIADSETNLEAGAINNSFRTSTAKSYYGDDDENDISELYTQVAKVGGLNIHHLHDKHELIYKRNRVFDIFKEENPPKLPDIHAPELLAKVFTHQSVLNYLNIPEESKVHSHNERLEFLGDAFLQFVVSMIIYEKFPNFNEGQLSILRSNIVSNSRLLKLSQVYGFDKKLKKNFNDSTILTGNNKLYADVFEAYLGAIAEQYMMESREGETNTTDFMKGWFDAKDWLEELCEEQLRSFDPSIVFKMQYSKSSKQDLRLLLGQLNIPDYVRCNLTNRRILSCVKVAKKVYGYGVGTSNKEADSRAATDAMSNPGIRKICPDELWKKFEDGVGIDASGALKFDQYPTKVSSADMNILKKEIAIKYRSGDIKLLASKNNPTSFLITDKEREEVVKELNDRHSLNNTYGEITGSESASVYGGSTTTNSSTGSELQAKEDKKYPKDLFYSKEYTMGRGGIFGEEYKRVSKGESKHRGGIYRNEKFIIIEGSEGDLSSLNVTRSILCHEVLAKCEEVEMDSKNRMNAILARRGGIPGYITYKTIDDEFLCEMWFSNKQIVSYGLDKNKKLASQKAAMLAYKREEYYGNSVDDDDDDEEEEEEEEDDEEGNEEEDDYDSDEERERRGKSKNRHRCRQSESDDSSN